MVEEQLQNYPMVLERRVYSEVQSSVFWNCNWTGVGVFISSATMENGLIYYIFGEEIVE